MGSGAETRGVLLVEDDEGSRELLMMMLESAGFTVSAFPNAESALEEAAGHSPFLVITDVTLPGISGDELVRRLRACPERASLKAFALTGHSAADVVAQAPDTFDKIFVKPMDMAIVVQEAARV